MPPAPRKSLFSSLASTAEHEQLPAALVEWVEAQPGDAETRDESAGLEALKDGIRLAEILAQIDLEYFAPLVDASAAPNVKALGENWILRFNHLKKVYRLVVRYFEETLSSSTANLLTPNLRLVAKNDPRDSDDEICKLIGLVLALAVQSPKKQEHIARIQKLEEWVQRELMYSIEQVMSKVQPLEIAEDAESEEAAEVGEPDAADDFYTMRHEKSRILHDKEALQVLYDQLSERFGALKDEHEETLGTLTASEARNVELTEQAEKSARDRPEHGLKVEIERLRAELQKTATDLGEAEQVVDSQTQVIQDLSRKVEDLEPRAEEADRLKDQLDEYRHASEKAKKQENVIEKYKKKLEDAAETKRMLKTLEEQNVDLLDKNATLEDEYAKVAAYKPLLDSYKTKVDALETKSSTLQRDMEALRLDLERARDKLQKTEEERQRGAENLAVYEERVRELEMNGPSSSKMRRSDTGTSVEDLEGGLGSELGDALSGATPTDLKLRIRRLERELSSLRGGDGATGSVDASQHAVLQDLLDDANRLKDRYQQEYLADHREKLVLNARLEEVISGNSRLGDGPEAALAVRHRLNETVAELEQLRKEHAELEVKLAATERELTIAKSDLSLVNLDQIEALHALRASVSSEKEDLEGQVDSLRSALRDAEDKARQQLDEVNRLLSERVREQDVDLSVRDRALQREAELREARAALAARDADSARLSALEREKTDLLEKVQKMKEFIKQQDKLFRAEQAASSAKSSGEGGEGEEARLREELVKLKAELARMKAKAADAEAAYRKDQATMLASFHDLAIKASRDRVLTRAVVSPDEAQRPYQPQSWLSQQRARAQGKGLRHG